LGEQAFQVIVFAYKVVVGTEVEDDVRSLHGHVATGRNGGPYVFADFDAEGAGGGTEQYVLVQGYLLTAYEQCAGGYVCSAGEPSFFVKFLVIGQVGFGYHTQNFSLLYDCGAVQQGSFIGYGQSYYADDVQTAGEVHELYQGHLGLLQEELLLEEVLAGVGCERELGQTDDFHSMSFCLYDERFYLLYVILAVGHPH